MNNKNLSLSNAQRVRLLDAYRGRGHRIGNLFVVYSVKTDCDWILPSDRHLIYWIHYLETNPEVRGFAFLQGTDCDKSPGIVDVLLSDGRRTKHRLGQVGVEKHSCLDDGTATNTASSINAQVFTDDDLQPFVRSSIRWMKAIAFASALRDCEYTHQTVVLLDYFKRYGKGDIGGILADAELCEREPPVVLGLIARLCIKGHITLDLTTNTFGYCTPWVLSVDGL